MSLNDDAVFTAAKGYIFTNVVGAARPTAAQLTDINPTEYGAQVQTITVTSATGGSFTVKNLVSETAVSVAYDASVSALQSALESLPSIGAGNVSVSGTGLSTGLAVAFVGKLQGKALSTLTISSSGLTGSSAVATASITTAPNGWELTGHTSRNDMPEWGFDGGDKEVQGTWQNDKLRERETDPLVDYLTAVLQQIDKGSFELYYGPNSSTEAGVFAVSGDTNQPNERSILVIIEDGDTKLGFYVPKASVSRGDAVDSPVDGFMSFPIKATFLKLGNRPLFEWINEDWFPLSA